MAHHHGMVDRRHTPSKQCKVADEYNSIELSDLAEHNTCRGKTRNVQQNKEKERKHLMDSLREVSAQGIYRRIVFRFAVSLKLLFRRSKPERIDESAKNTGKVLRD